MKGLKPEEFPALRNFLSGYLHEDFAQEHETPEGAVRALSREARADEIEPYDPHVGPTG